MLQQAPITDVNESNLQQVLEQSMQVPVLFYFWSARSQHCQELTPVLEKLAGEYQGQFVLAKLDCDEQQMVASQFGLRAIPTVYLFKDGQPVDGFRARNRKTPSAHCCKKFCRVKMKLSFNRPPHCWLKRNRWKHCLY